MTLRVVHAHGDAVGVSVGDVEILRYVYRPDPVAFESRKPYAHPVRTLGGRVVTGYRPNDHRWHKGLQMTASHLSGQNRYRVVVADGAWGSERVESFLAGVAW
ncbi:hypothetical protein SUDANB130_05846 [Streptomyces sp. enrichment culture]